MSDQPMSHGKRKSGGAPVEQQRCVGVGAVGEKGAIWEGGQKGGRGRPLCGRDPGCARAGMRPKGHLEPRRQARALAPAHWSVMRAPLAEKESAFTTQTTYSQVPYTTPRQLPRFVLSRTLEREDATFFFFFFFFF